VVMRLWPLVHNLQQQQQAPVIIVAHQVGLTLNPSICCHFLLHAAQLTCSQELHNSTLHSMHSSRLLDQSECARDSRLVCLHAELHAGSHTCHSANCNSSLQSPQLTSQMR